jgi:hypothetical protein
MGSKVIVVLAILIVGAGFLGFTSPGHQVLSKLGFATACTTPSC